MTIFSFLIPSVKSVFNNLILSSSNYDETNVLRAMGFASVGGASFSVIQSTGVISLLILLKFINLNYIKRFLIWISILIILVSIFFVGRTGMFISFIAIFIYVISLKVKFRNVAVILMLLFLVFQINYTSFIENLTSGVDGFRSDLFINWIESSFKVKDNDTTDALNEMPVPPLSFETIIGTGRVRSITGNGNASGHDSGYVQTYYSLGLLLAICFYIFFLIFAIFLIQRNKFQKYYDSKKQKILYLLILIVFVIEIKEPFIFHYSFPFFVLSSILNINKGYLDNNLKLIKPKVAFVN
jgi:O-antigen ligase